MLLSKVAKLVPFLSSQVLTQAISLGVGLLVVRLLPVEDYAAYALFGALAGAAAIATDLGSSGSLVTLVSRTSSREERNRIADQISRLRTGLVAASASIFCVIFFHVTPTVGWQAYAASVVLGALIILQSRAVLYRARLACDGALKVISWADPIAAGVRMALVGGAMLIVNQSGLLFPIFASVLSSIVLVAVMRSWSGPLTCWPPTLPDAPIRRIMLPLLPGHLYAIVLGILPFAFLGAKAAPTDMAEFGALLRLGAVFGALSPFISLVAHPYVSAGHDAGFTARSLMVLGSVISLVTFVVCSGAVVPEIWLFLLGSSYFHLEAYVWMALLNAGVTIISGVFYSMTVASGETRFQYAAVPVGLAVQGLIVWALPIDDLDTAFVFVLLTASLNLLIQASFYCKSLVVLKKRTPRVPA